MVWVALFGAEPLYQTASPGENAVKKLGACVCWSIFRSRVQSLNVNEKAIADAQDIFPSCSNA